MSNEVLLDAISQLDDKHLETFFLYSTKQNASNKKRKKGVIKWISAVAACIAFVMILSHTAKFEELFPHHTETAETYYLINLTSMKIYGETASRPSVISPYPSANKCFERELTPDVLSKLFQTSDFDKAGIETDNLSGRILYHSTGEVHTVNIQWSYDDGSVYVIIDPIAYPRNILDKHESTSEINGYLVGMVEYYPIGNDSTICNAIDVGMKKGSMGILLSELGDCKDQLDKIYNFILNSEIDIKSIYLK